MVLWQMNHTRIGLHIRATMQSRDMARSLGVNTRRVDRFTFAFGAGLAGVAGYAWTLIGGVTPDMGQTNFIVDSFLVVVVGSSYRVQKKNINKKKLGWCNSKPNCSSE